VPDAMFGLAADVDERHEAAAGARPRPHPNSTDPRSSPQHCPETYFLAWQGRLHEERWSIPNMRVLFVTPTPGRTENMLRELEKVTGGGSRFFLFTDVGAERHRSAPP
jgi:hypothetical protein